MLAQLEQLRARIASGRRAPAARGRHMLLILGLDGATLDLVEPWAADGTLPNLARLMRDGAWGRSRRPAGGDLPELDDVHDRREPGPPRRVRFHPPRAGEYRVRFVNATFRKARTVWRLLSDAGRRVSVLGLPGPIRPNRSTAT